MRIGLFFIAVLSAVTPLLAMRAPGAQACSCAPFPADEAGIRHQVEDPAWSDAVFAIAVTESRSEADRSTAEATVRIERVYRGRIAERVEIRGEGLGGSCDYVPAEAGSRDFLVMYPRGDGKYAASLCGSVFLGAGADPASQAFSEALRRVSDGIPPDPIDAAPDAAPRDAEAADGDDVASTWILVAIAVSVVLPVVGGALLLARRSRAR